MRSKLQINQKLDYHTLLYYIAYSLHAGITLGWIPLGNLRTNQLFVCWITTSFLHCVAESVISINPTIAKYNINKLYTN